MIAEGDMVIYNDEDVILTRIYVGEKWAKIETVSGDAMWVPFILLSEKEK